MKRRSFNISRIALLVTALISFAGCKKNEPLYAPITPEVAGTWTQINMPPGNALLPTSTGFLSFSPGFIDIGGYDLEISPDRTAPALWYSSDHGTSWASVLNPASTSEFTVQVDLINNSHVVVYSATDSTFYNSTDGGKSWTILAHLTAALVPQSGPIDSAQVIALINGQFDTTVNYYQSCFYGVSGNNLFVLRQNAYVNQGGFGNTNYLLLESSNKGSTWDTVYRPNYDWKSPEELYSVGSYLLQINRGQIVGSADNGLTWSIFNSNSPVTFPGGILSNGSVAAFDDSTNSIFTSHDSTKSWQLFCRNSSFGGPVLAFDSIIITPTTNSYSNYCHIICTNSQKINWLAADNGLQTDGAYTNLYVDDTYLYAFRSSPYAGPNAAFYRRPRSDFKGL